MPGRKQTSAQLSSLASRILSGQHVPSAEDAVRLAASLLSQDETVGQGKRHTPDPVTTALVQAKTVLSTVVSDVLLEDGDMEVRDEINQAIEAINAVL